MSGSPSMSPGVITGRHVDAALGRIATRFMSRI